MVRYITSCTATIRAGNEAGIVRKCKAVDLRPRVLRTPAQSPSRTVLSRLSYISSNSFVKHANNRSCSTQPVRRLVASREFCSTCQTRSSAFGLRRIGPEVDRRDPHINGAVACICEGESLRWLGRVCAAVGVHCFRGPAQPASTWSALWRVLCSTCPSLSSKKSIQCQKCRSYVSAY